MDEKDLKDQAEKKAPEEKAEQADKKAEKSSGTAGNGPEKGDQRRRNIGSGARIAITVLAVLVLILVAYIVSDKLGKKDDSTSSGTEASQTENKEEKKTEAVTEAKTEAKSEAATEKKTEAKSEEKTEEKKGENETVQKPALEAKVTVANSWSVGSSFVVQYNTDIKNNSDEVVKHWDVRMPGFTDTKMENQWGAEFELKGDILIAKAADYNLEIPAKGSINYGYQVIFKNEDASKKVDLKKAEIYVNGAPYDETVEVPAPKKVEKKTAAEPENGSPLEVHGQLSVKDKDLVDKDGKPYQLKGVSTHGLAWFPDYVNLEAFRTFREKWGANLIRLAMYTGESGGYCSGGDQEKLKGLVEKGVDYADQLGMYVIIDWHILSDNNPKINQDEAIAFFDEMSKKYADHKNVLFEICNEPNGGTTWADVKEYAETVIPVIRKNAPNAIILVGTPTWSQDVDQAALDPIKDQKNIMYTLHFYAATHKENIQNKLKTAREAGLPIFISEFSICEASGNGTIDYDSAVDWFNLINEYNLSYAGWNVSNKAEASSLIRSDCTKTSDWTDEELSETGLWLKETMK